MCFYRRKNSCQSTSDTHHSARRKDPFPQLTEASAFMNRRIEQQLIRWDADYSRASKSVEYMIENLIMFGRVEGAVICGAADALVHAGLSSIGPDATVRMLKDLIELIDCLDVATDKRIAVLADAKNDNTAAKRNK